MSRLAHPGVPTPRRALVRTSKPRVVGRTAEGRAITREKVRVLAELATWPAGTGAIAGVLDGGSLAALVQLGVAESIGADRVGGCRYRATDEGLELLTRLGVLQQPESARG